MSFEINKNKDANPNDDKKNIIIVNESDSALFQHDSHASKILVAENILPNISISGTCGLAGHVLGEKSGSNPAFPGKQPQKPSDQADFDHLRWSKYGQQ